MSTLEKNKLLSENELIKFNEEYRWKNQEQHLSYYIIVTPKRRCDDIDNDAQEIENDTFQVVEEGIEKNTSMNKFKRSNFMKKIFKSHFIQKLPRTITT